MTRYSIDCREYPSDSNCTVEISADSKKELVDAAVQHAVAVHGHQDTPALREQIGGMAKTSG
jgi:predicted small metal-binding protein